MQPFSSSVAPPEDSAHPAPDVSVIIPSWNTIELTRRCLYSLFAVDHDCRLEVIVIDNGSADGSAEMVAREFPSAKLIRNERNEYYSRACNQGARASTAPLLCFLNSDTEVPPGSLKTIIQFMRENSDYGAAAPRLSYPDGSVQAICRRFPTLMEVMVDQFSLSWWPTARRYRARVAMSDFDHLSSRDVEQPPGACLIMPSGLFRELGGFDESLPLFYSDVDLCLRIWQAGKRIRFLHDTTVVHVGSASIVRHPLWRGEFMRNQVRYLRKHHGWFAAQWARAIILSSAIRTMAFTAVGRRAMGEKSRILREVSREVRIAVGR